MDKKILKNGRHDSDNPSCFCLIDVGSTTTKAILFFEGPEWRYIRRESPTTVEKPFEDVTFGVVKALKALEKESGLRLMKDGVPCLPCFSTSSAGGGLAIVVAGLIAEVTARSAERVALGAGAIVQDVIALNDERTPYKKIETLKHLRPDMILLAGGFNDGAVHGPVYLAELLNQSGLRPKLSERGMLPVIYAGNERAREFVEEQLSSEFIYHPVANLRPSDYQENLDPARQAIHDVFMDHVMSRAPGYEKYKSWISAPILPTPAAVARILALVSRDLKKKILAVDIGGATTDVFTAEEGKVFRTVSANLGMSYSILNVVRQGGLEAITDLLDTNLDPKEVLNGIGNKYLNPTRLPDSVDDVRIECAVASIAIREAILEHLSVLQGVSLSMTEEEMTRSIIKRKKKGRKPSTRKPSFKYDMVIGSGGKLSHSPRKTAAMILGDSLPDQEIIELAVDGVFMFPQLGVLSQVDEKLALDFFYKFGLVKLGTLIKPAGTAKPGKKEVRVVGYGNSSYRIDERIPHGEIRFIPLENKESVSFTIKPEKLKLKNKKIQFGKDAGALIVDARGTPPISRSDYYIEDDIKWPQRRSINDTKDKIYIGEFRETRELAVAGDVFVKPGDTVVPETIIAKSTRMFLRPFFLPIAEQLGVPPHDLETCFNKKVGDEIEAGEIIAQRKRGVINVKDFVSPVSAVIEKILPTGTVIAREKPEQVKKRYAIDIAREMNIKPSRVKNELQVKLGQEVEKGQVIAGNIVKGPGQPAARSPLRGKVSDIDFEDGIVTIEPLLEELELMAWLPGKVSEVADRGCVISNTGIIIQGIWGEGAQVSGRLSRDKGYAGDIVFQEMTERADLERLAGKQIAGLITGSLHLRDFNDIKPSYSVVITEGFGMQKMNPEIVKALVSHIGKLAAIDPRTQLRAGVKRPRIILPDNQS